MRYLAYVGSVGQCSFGADHGHRDSAFAEYGTSLVSCFDVTDIHHRWTDKFQGKLYSQEDGFLNTVRSEPLAVTADIIPWNDPISNVSLKAGPALTT